MLESIRNGANKLFDKAEKVADNIQDKAKELKGYVPIIPKDISIYAGQNWAKVIAVKDLVLEVEEELPVYVTTSIILEIKQCVGTDTLGTITIKESELLDIHTAIAKYVKNTDIYKRYKEDNFTIIAVTGYRHSFLI